MAKLISLNGEKRLIAAVDILRSTRKDFA